MGGIDMVKEDYVSFEIAKLLKEKGFDEPISNCYLELDKGGYIDIEMSDECHQNERYESEDSSWKFGTLLLRPTYQMVMKWLRERHGILITIDFDEYELTSDNKKVGYGYNIQKIENPTEHFKISTMAYDTYEEAVEEGISYSLINLI